MRQHDEESLKRAARRAAYHLMRAASEVLTAVSVALEELGHRAENDEGEDDRLRRIPVE